MPMGMGVKTAIFLSGGLQKLADLFIRQLRKMTIPNTYGHERVRSPRANHFITTSVFFRFNW